MVKIKSILVYSDDWTWAKLGIKLAILVFQESNIDDYLKAGFKLTPGQVYMPEHHTFD